MLTSRFVSLFGVIAGVFARRGYNIQSLAVGPSERDGMSRIVTVIPGNAESTSKIIKQLYKLVSVQSVSPSPFLQSCDTILLHAHMIHSSAIDIWLQESMTDSLLQKQIHHLTTNKLSFVYVLNLFNMLSALWLSYTTLSLRDKTYKYLCNSPARWLGVQNYNCYSWLCLASIQVHNAVQVTRPGLPNIFVTRVAHMKFGFRWRICQRSLSRLKSLCLSKSNVQLLCGQRSWHWQKSSTAISVMSVLTL